MRKQQIPKHIVCSAISFSCPVVAVIAVLAYQSVVHYSFWGSLTPEDSTAGALMAIGEVFQVVLFSSTRFGVRSTH